MTLLKSFGTVVAPIMMSEIVNHASAEKCDNLLTAEEPDEDALHKGADLVLMVLFWFKYVPLNFLGVTRRLIYTGQELKEHYCVRL